MPNCFALIDRNTKQPANLQSVDNAMREHFGAEPSDTDWFCGWYDSIGFALALGNSLEKCRELFSDTRLVPIIDWIDENYSTDAWAER